MLALKTRLCFLTTTPYMHIYIYGYARVIIKGEVYREQCDIYYTVQWCSSKSKRCSILHIYVKHIIGVKQNVIRVLYFAGVHATFFAEDCLSEEVSVSFFPTQ